MNVWATLFVFACFLLCKLRFAFGKSNYVTCGSVVKLYNEGHGFRLHSHDVKYGSGSGQQSVTGIEDTDDNNSHWVVLGINETAHSRGQPIRCNDLIRLQHSVIRCYLHSHLFSSPLSQNQEVSCFGKEEGGDTGDYWSVECKGDFWTRDEKIGLKHKDTMAFLATSGKKYNRPISGQMEICGIESDRGRNTLWSAKEGVFIEPSESSGSQETPGVKIPATQTHGEL